MSQEQPGLDPEDWSDLRDLGHKMVDDMVAYLANARECPVWQKMPDAVRLTFTTDLPDESQDLANTYVEFQRSIQPYVTGNTHPGFMGWVHGGGNAVGMLADLLAAGMNANVGGRDHAPVEVERQVIRWAAELVGLPKTSSGVLVTGSSLANFIALLVARQAAIGPAIREQGLGTARLTAYGSEAAHVCLIRAMEMAGIGSDALRRLPTNSNGQADLAALSAAIAQDRQDGFTPFLLAGTAGTVDTGAIDDLDGMADLAAKENLWFHVDGALGAIAMLSDRLRPKFFGIERADSVALDFHKWGQVPYDAGCVIVRDAALHAATFASPTAYLSREVRGLASGHPWPTDFGPDLSRGFRALKVWMTLKTYGRNLLAAQIDRSCDLAADLVKIVVEAPDLELLAPVALNIVCFRFVVPHYDLDALNRDIVADLQESGMAVPSTTIIDGKLAIRAALVNHRIRREDIDRLIDGVRHFGRCRTMQAKVAIA